MRNKKIIFYFNTLLFLAVLLFAINTFSPGGHEFIRSVLAQAGIVGGGTVSYLARFAGAQGAPSNTIGDSVIYQGTNNKIGIGFGAVEPTWPLTVNGYVSSNWGFVTGNRSGGVGDSVLYRDGDITHLWTTSGGDVINYNNSGNVGIGTAPGTGRLAVSTENDPSWKALYTISGYIMTIQAKIVSRFLPFIEWRDLGGIRAGYMGWGNNDTAFGPKTLDLGLENGFNFKVTGGALILAPQAQPATLTNGMMWMEP